MDPDGDFQFLMDLMSESSVYEHSSGSDRDSEPEHAPLSVQIHSLTANVYLDCPIEELVPARYVREAEKSRMEFCSRYLASFGFLLTIGFVLSSGRPTECLGVSLWVSRRTRYGSGNVVQYRYPLQRSIQGPVQSALV